MSRNIWICYRHSDNSHIGEKVCRSLKEIFEKNPVIEITDAPASGVVTSTSRVRSGDLIIFLVGPTWLTATDERGQRFLTKSDDFIVIHLQHALTVSKLTIMMVMAGGARTPTEADLPLNLSSLTKKRPITLTLHGATESDINRLIHAIRNTWIDTRRSVWPFAAAGLMLLIVALAVILRVPPLQNVSEQMVLLIETRDPNRPAAYFDEGRTAYDKGDYQTAVEKYLRALVLKPDYAEAYNGLAWSYYQLNNHDLALSTFNRLINVSNGAAASYTDRGWYYYNTENYEFAIEDFNRAISSAPELPDGYYGLGLANDKLQRFPEALEAYQRYLELTSNPEISVKSRVLDLQQQAR